MPARKPFFDVISKILIRDKGKNKLWQKDQQKRQWRRNLFRFGLIVAVIFLLNLVWQAISLKNSLERPFQNLPGEISHSRSLNLESRVNLLLFSFTDEKKVKSIVVASYDGQNETLRFFPIPLDVYVGSLDGLRWSMIGNLYEEGMAESGRGVGNLLNGVRELLMIPLDGYLAVAEAPDAPDNVLGESSLKNAHEEIRDFSFFFNLFNFKSWGEKHLRTNLSLRNLFDLTWRIRGIRYDGIKYYQTQDLFQKTTLAGGLEGKVLNTLVADTFLDEAFSDSVFSAERMSVEIKNGTEIAGLGGSAARFLTRLGVKVNRVGNAEERISETVIYHYRGKELLVNQIKESLGVGKVIKPESEEISKEDILVILGEDYLEKK